MMDERDFEERIDTFPDGSRRMMRRCIEDACGHVPFAVPIDYYIGRGLSLPRRCPSCRNVRRINQLKQTQPVEVSHENATPRR